jgi:cyclophilin family peptidyl-prolyl cis-trans isomerase
MAKDSVTWSLNSTLTMCLNFISIASGNNPTRLSYEGTKIDKGFPGIVIQGGKIGEENIAAEGRRLPDENTTLRHYKRGIISM